MGHPHIEKLDTKSSTMTLSLDIGLYPADVLYAAAYVFLDRAYVVLDRAGPRFEVHLRGKAELTEAQLTAMSGEFENELLAQALRRKVIKANQKIIEDITSQAIAGAAGGTLPTDFLAAGDDGMDFLDDPLGIAVPWEDKFKKKKDA